MRLSTDEGRDEQSALETLDAALAAGITVFDTAHAYGHGQDDLGHNERLLARALRAAGAGSRARVVTKGGMARRDGSWVPDGRAIAIRADCDASLAALDGLPIDTYLVHAPDPRTPWRTTVRALARIREDGLARRVGVANVNRAQLDEAIALAPVAAVQVALSPYDEAALRGGLLERCADAGIAVIAHSPLGGPRRAGRVERDPELTAIAARLQATPAEVALTWVLSLAPNVVAVPGARRPETARSAARAATLRLAPTDRRRLGRAFGRPTEPRRTRRAPARTDADVVLVMGIPGAGKSRVAEEHAARGYLRLNRDERGGTLRELAEQLDGELASGARRIVLDNTYLTRATRSYVVDAARKHGVPVRCIWLDTPLAQAQANMVERLLEHEGALPGPEQLEAVARGVPGVLTPTSQMRTLRELEPPAPDEGFAEIEIVPFERGPSPGSGVAVFVGAGALARAGWPALLASLHPEAPHLLFDWRPDAGADALAAEARELETVVSGPVATALCPHGGGPPHCWCRPPLPGLLLAFARAQAVAPALSTVVGTSTAHRTLATTLGARYVEA